MEGRPIGGNHGDGAPPGAGGIWVERIRPLAHLVEAPIPFFLALYLLRPELYLHGGSNLVPPLLTHPVWLESMAVWVVVAFTLGLWRGVQGKGDPLTSLLWAYGYVAIAFATSSLAASLLLHWVGGPAVLPFRIASVALGIGTAAPLLFLPAVMGGHTSSYFLPFLALDLMGVALAWLGHRLGNRITHYFLLSHQSRYS